LDRSVFLGLSDGSDAQAKILSALTRKFTLAPGIDFAALLKQSNKRLTGADFYALATDALIAAIKRQIQRIDETCVRLGIQNSRTFLKKIDSGGAAINQFGFDPLSVQV
jgi:peroxin-6